VTGNLRIRLQREAAMFYYGICPRPTKNEYEAMAIALCNACPQLKDKQNDLFWVNN
jgi:hypothetical protein